MPFLKIVKRLRQNEYLSLEEKFTSERIVDILFPVSGGIRDSDLSIYINKDMVNCYDLSKDDDSYITNVFRDIEAIKERNKLYINGLIDAHSCLNQGNTATSKYLIELDKNYVSDKIDLEQVVDIINRYNKLKNCSDVNPEDVKLILIGI